MFGSRKTKTVWRGRGCCGCYRRAEDSTKRLTNSATAGFTVCTAHAEGGGKANRFTGRNRVLRRTGWFKKGRMPHIRGGNLGAWRLAALGSGVALRDTGDLSVRRQKADGNRRLLRRVTGEAFPNVGWLRRLETLRAGGLGGVLLRQVYFFVLFSGWGKTPPAAATPHPSRVA